MAAHAPEYGSIWPRKIKAKKLHNKITKILQTMHAKIAGDLQFEAQDMDTKREFYQAIDHVKAFLDNVK